MVFLTALAVLFPLFSKIGLGWLIRRVIPLSDETISQMNNIIFRIFLPALLFVNIYQSDFASISSFGFLLFSLAVLLTIFTLLLLFIPCVERENPRRGVLVQGISRSNFIFFGLPMAVSLYGGTSKGVASLLVGVLVPVLNVISVIALEYFRGNKPDVKKIFKSVAVNPILIGGALGLLFVVLGITLPSPVENFLVDISEIATPLALILLGCSVTFTSVRENRRALLFAVAGRLLIVPAFGVGLALLFGFRDLELILLMALFASPTAVSSFTMAQQMGGDSALAAQIVVLTTTLSLFSLFGWITLLMGLGFF
ncbi:MAG: AEC family transporter [Sphaerochaeta sp.]|jgi:predicted permease|nr:AEC family transporter [Sphaerochaeta sp.]MDX9914936.1 AEC family transporter [Sphaerochaeta sp.]